MNNSKLTYPVFISLSLAALFQVAAIAKAETIPFKASIAITESVNLPTTILCAGLQGDVLGKGASPKLGGSITVSSTDCIIPTNPELTEFVALSSNGVLTTSRGTLNFGSVEFQVG